MKTPIMRSTVVVVLALAAFACARRTQEGAGPGDARSAPSKIVVDYLEGSVTIDGSPAVIGQAVNPKAVIATGPASLCQIIFDDKNIVHIGDEATLELDFTTVQKSIHLKSGSIAGALTKLAALTDPTAFAMTIRTATTVGGVRGTVFFTRAEDPSNTYTCTCNGVVHLADPSQGNAQTVEAAHHRAYRYTAAGGAFAVSDAGMLYHTDQMMELGAAKVGYTIDWTRIPR